MSVQFTKPLYIKHVKKEHSYPAKYHENQKTSKRISGNIAILPGNASLYLYSCHSIHACELDFERTTAQVYMNIEYSSVE